MKNTYKFVCVALLAFAVVAPSAASALEADVDPNPQTNQCVALTSTALRSQSRDTLTGGEVSTLQAFLQGKGHLNSEPTGYFGLLTFAAVKKFQSENGIEPTGYPGPITRGKIRALTGCDDKNAVVPVPSVAPVTPVVPVTSVAPLNTVPPVLPQSYPTITILAPTNGQRINAQRQLFVEWQTTDLSSSEKILTVRLRDMNDGSEHYLASDIYNTGKANFSIPTDLPNGKYALELKTAVNRNGSNLSIIGRSQPFSLVDSKVVQLETNNTVVNTVPTDYYNNPATNDAVSTSKQDLETRISMQILDSTKPFAGAWGQFALDPSVNSQAKKNWNWELNLQPRNSVKKSVVKIVVEHEGSNQRWSTGDSFNWPLVVRQDGSTLNSSYGPLDINLSGDTKYSFRLYGDIDNRAQSGTLVTVFYNDGTYSQTKIDGKRPTLDSSDTNNNSEVVRPLDPKITIVAPNSGNRIDVYNSRSINAQWKSVNLSSTYTLSGVRLRNVDTGKEYFLDSGVMNDGLERFKVPGGIADDTDEGRYVLEIKTEVPGRSGTILATSEPFVITSSMPRKVPLTPITPVPTVMKDTTKDVTGSVTTAVPTVTPASSIQFKYPNGGESWQSGVNQTQEFSWTFNGDSNNTKVGISIMNISNYAVTTVVNGASSTSSYKWTVPAGIATGGYKAYIWVTDSRGNIIAKDDSDKDFYILGERR